MTEDVFSGSKPKWKPQAPESPNEAAIRQLKEAMPLLDQSSRSFAQSLVQQYNNRGELSPKQWPYVHKMIGQAATPAAPRPAGFGPIVAMMDKAFSGTQFPRFDFECDGLALRMTRNGKQSKTPGAVAIVTATKSYSDRLYYGRIDRDGTLVLSDNGKKLPSLEVSLRAIVQDPALVARSFARRFSRCGFCDQDLTNPNSVAAGYGPICAGNYNLPWGDEHTKHLMLTEIEGAVEPRRVSK